MSTGVFGRCACMPKKMSNSPFGAFGVAWRTYALGTVHCRTQELSQRRLWPGGRAGVGRERALVSPHSPGVRGCAALRAPPPRAARRGRRPHPRARALAAELCARPSAAPPPPPPRPRAAPSPPPRASPPSSSPAAGERALACVGAQAPLPRSHTDAYDCVVRACAPAGARSSCAKGPSCVRAYKVSNACRCALPCTCA
jgi:hypothetical protein